MISMQVKDKLKNYSKEKGIDFNIALKYYVFDRFIVRLSISKYKDNFILKGGFLLSTLFGLENRSTMDIDVAFKNATFTEENIQKMINSIISINMGDNIDYNILQVSPIRQEDKYGGYRFTMQFKFENIKELLKIDIATGDPITPSAITYEYKPILNDTVVKLWTYNIETVIAEKIESIFSKLESTSRMKDYYDLYLIYTKDWNNININHLREAIKNTFNKREFNNSIADSFKIISNSVVLFERWKAYSRRYEYAKDLDFNTILKYIAIIINTIEPVTV